MSKESNPWRVYTQIKTFLVNENGRKIPVNIQDAGCIIVGGEWRTEFEERKYLVADTPEGIIVFFPDKDGKMTDSQREAWENEWTE